MATPADELTRDAPLLSAASFEGTIKAYYPYWDAQYRPYLIDAVRLLPAGQFDWKPRPDMFTAQQIVLHIAEAERYWLRHVVDGEPDYVDYVIADEAAGVGWTSAYDAPDHNALLFALEDAHRHTQRWFGLPAAELAKTRTRTRVNGERETMTLHWILDHVQEHEIHHRAQLNHYLRLMGLTPPSI
jgi:uncharacterized damage-inducible protein DinB